MKESQHSDHVKVSQRRSTGPRKTIYNDHRACARGLSPKRIFNDQPSSGNARVPERFKNIDGGLRILNKVGKIEA